MWESLLQGTVGVVVAAIAGVVGSVALWIGEARRSERQRRENDLASLVADVQARAFAVTAAAGEGRLLNPFYGALVDLAAAVFSLVAALPEDGREFAVELDQRLNALGREIRQHEWQRWLLRKPGRVIEEAVGIASCVQRWHAAHRSAA